MHTVLPHTVLLALVPGLPLTCAGVDKSKLGEASPSFDLPAHPRAWNRGYCVATYCLSHICAWCAGSVHGVQVLCMVCRFCAWCAGSVHGVQVLCMACRFCALCACPVHGVDVLCMVCTFSAWCARSVHGVDVLCMVCTFCAWMQSLH